MAAGWLEQVGHGSRLVRACGSRQPIGYSKWDTTANWLEQMGHGSRLVTASGTRQQVG